MNPVQRLRLRLTGSSPADDSDNDSTHTVDSLAASPSDLVDRFDQIRVTAASVDSYPVVTRRTRPYFHPSVHITAEQWLDYSQWTRPKGSTSIAK
jgi:hypothetical protein